MGGVRIHKVLAVNLRMLRRKSDMGQRELAKKAGVSQPLIGLIETCQRSPSLVKLAAIAKALKVEPALLLKKDLE